MTAAYPTQAAAPASGSRDWDAWAARHGYRRTNPGDEPAHYVQTHGRPVRASAHTPRMPTEAELLEQLLPLCRMIALDHAGRWEREDLEQEAAIGALQAVRRWDPGRGIPLAAFARQRIKGAVLNHMEATTPRLVTKRQWRAGQREGAVVVFLSIEGGDDEAETWRAREDPGFELVEALADYRAAA